MRIDIYLHGGDQPELRAIQTQLAAIMGKLNNMSAEIDAALTTLQADVTAENTVIDSAVALINGFAAQLAAAVAAAQAAGATPAQLQAFTDLGTSITTKSGELSAAVAANTPPPPPAP